MCRSEFVLSRLVVEVSENRDSWKGMYKNVNEVWQIILISGWRFRGIKIIQTNQESTHQI
jgi:hypothetical protein